jgi:translation initiation factor 3 subunit B
MGEVFWEPHGDKFAVVATEMQRNYVYMYVMEKQGKKLSDVTGICLIEKMERKGINTVAWNPKGRFCVFAGLKPAQGDLEFWDMDNKLLMGTNEHYMATDVQWDASGRYVASSVSYWQVQSDTGYVIWNMTGQMVSRLAFPIFKQFLWRPRPETLLSKDEQKKIEKNLKQYAKEFDDLDTVRTTKASKQVVDRRVELWNEWMAFRKAAFDNTVAQTEERVELYGLDPFAENMEEFEEIEEVIEEVLEETIEIVE